MNESINWPWVPKEMVVTTQEAVYSMNISVLNLKVLLCLFPFSPNPKQPQHPGVTILQIMIPSSFYYGRQIR